MMGPGKYDAQATAARAAADAETVLLIVLNGVHGSGFSVQTTSPQTARALPMMLRTVADQIEADLPGPAPDTVVQIRVPG